jgi:hypothetical protein
MASFFGYVFLNKTKQIKIFIKDNMLNINILQTGLDSDSVDQLQSKLKRYTTEIEFLRERGIGKEKENFRRVFLI